MERTLTPDERVRRAEEIYYRKKIQAGYRDTARVNVNERPNFNILRKMFLQIAICVLIYGSLYLVQTTNYVFSEDVIDRTKRILSYDINFNMLYSQITEYINGIIDEQGETEEQEAENENKEESIEDVETDNTAHPQEDELGQGGLYVDEIEDISNLSQMELDAKEINAHYSITSPLTGTITSRFGNRNPTTPSVPKYHTGIDIAVNEGTVFVAAMEGTVTLVSGIGDYRKPYKNSEWRYTDGVCSL